MQVWKSQQCSHSRNECEAKNQGKQDFKGQEKADTVQQVRWREEQSTESQDTVRNVVGTGNGGKP